MYTSESAMRLLMLLGIGLLSVPAFAGDDLDDILGDDDDDDLPNPAPAPDPGPVAPPADDADDDALDGYRDPVGGDDLLGEDPDSKTLPGSDTGDIYRAAQNKAAKMAEDEEVEFWNNYLAQYPNTSFRESIQGRIDELMASLYNGTPIGGTDEPVDALKAQLGFAQGLALENINPRTRLSGGVEYGLPDYINLMLDYEQGLLRSFSVHAGIRQRYSGFSIEAGARWAPVKSVRTGTLLTFIGDFRLNANPAYPAVRPMLGFGQKLGDKVDLQLQGGADVEFSNPFDWRLLAGGNITVHASDAVGIFLESNNEFKNFDWVGGAFRFNVVSIGMKFYPFSGDPKKAEDLQVNVGANAPVGQNYWQYHYGSISAQGNYYLD